MANQFYLTLPSNSDASNTAATFITKLPRQIVLNGNWEVGLTEIIYANTWHNIAKEQNLVQFYDIINNTRQKIIIPRARYQGIDELTQTINKSIELVSEKDKFDYNSLIKFKYDVNKKSCSISIDSSKLQSLKFSKHLIYMLGFLDTQIENIDYAQKKMLTITAHHSPDMLGAMHNFYIYCDIIEPQIVGNVFAPLLQVLNMEGKYMDIINHPYISPHYIPILKKSFNTIEINIKTDQNEAVPFEFGKTILKLHFRRIE